MTISFLGFCAFFITEELYFGLIIFPIFVVKIILNKFFFVNRHLCELYIDMDNKRFRVDNFKSPYYVSFTNLKSFRNMKYCIELIFEEESVYFMPYSVFDFYFNDEKLTKDLIKIIRENKSIKNKI